MDHKLTLNFKLLLKTLPKLSLFWKKYAIAALVLKIVEFNVNYFFLPKSPI